MLNVAVATLPAAENEVDTEQTPAASILIDEDKLRDKLDDKDRRMADGRQLVQDRKTEKCRSIPPSPAQRSTEHGILSSRSHRYVIGDPDSLQESSIDAFTKFSGHGIASRACL